MPQGFGDALGWVFKFTIVFVAAVVVIAVAYLFSRRRK